MRDDNRHVLTYSISTACFRLLCMDSLLTSIAKWKVHDCISFLSSLPLNRFLFFRFLPPRILLSFISHSFFISTHTCILIIFILGFHRIIPCGLKGKEGGTYLSIDSSLIILCTLSLFSPLHPPPPPTPSLTLSFQ